MSKNLYQFNNTTKLQNNFLKNNTHITKKPTFLWVGLIFNELHLIIPYPPETINLFPR